MPQTNNRGQPKKELETDEKSWLLDFLDLPDITYTTPAKRNEVYIGKVDEKKLYKTIKYLLRTLNEVLYIANGCVATGIQSEDSFVSQFGRKVPFRQLYELIRFNEQYIYNQSIPYATCLCEICDNGVFFMQVVNQSLPKELNLPSNPHDSVEKFSCNSGSQDFTNSKCKEYELPEKIAESGAFETDNITFNEWKQVDLRAQTVSVSIDVKDVSSHFNAHVKTLKCHIHVKRIQKTAFNTLKSNLKERKEILVQADCTENYVNNDQAQIQKAKFGKKLFSIFTACCYLNIDGITINENITITSEANGRSRSAAMGCWGRVLSYIREKYQLADSLILHIWSDGCSGQFRSRYVLLSRFELTHTIFWYYNECHHGKEPIDGVYKRMPSISQNKLVQY